MSAVSEEEAERVIDSILRELGVLGPQIPEPLRKVDTIERRVVTLPLSFGLIPMWIRHVNPRRE